MIEIISLILISIFSAFILYKSSGILKNTNRNAWDVLFLNSTLGIIALFMTGILMNDKEIWLRVISFIGVVATGSAIAAVFIKTNDIGKS